MPQIGNLSISHLVIGEYLVEKAQQNKADLGLADVFFGDQALLPRTPALCVEPDAKSGNVNPTRKAEYEITFYLLVYYDKIQDSISNRKGLLALCDALETLYNSDQYLGIDAMSGLVIHNYISRVESGYVAKGQSLMTAARMTWTGKTQRILP